MKRSLLALLLVIMLVGVVFVARGYPDWSIDVIQHEGTTFVVTGNVDANVTNSTLDVNVTNSQLDVNVTNSTLNVAVEGVTSVSIDSATVTIDVATLKEKTEGAGRVFTLNGTEAVDSAGVETLIEYTNNLGIDIYIESVGAMAYDASTLGTEIKQGTLYYVLEVYNADNNIIFREWYDYSHFPANFDPALRVRDGWKIVLKAANSNTFAVVTSAWILCSY